MTRLADCDCFRIVIIVMYSQLMENQEREGVREDDCLPDSVYGECHLLISYGLVFDYMSP